MTTGVAEAWSAVRERMAAACKRSGRSVDSVQLVAVTKAFPTPRIRQLLACGHRLLGENRVQEALPKMDELGSAADWHLIGHLQTNKVRQVLGRFELIHSIDSERLALEIERRAEHHGARQGVLLQVNVAGEPTKFGLAEQALEPFVERLAALEHVETLGLMAIPPPAPTPEDNRRWFARLREIRDRCSARSGLALGELSMGMTDDFEVAIEEGATLVRVGRAIFGERGTSPGAGVALE